MRTLVVSYLPRESSSNTKRLLDAVISSFEDVDHLELSSSLPPLFDAKKLQAYYSQAYLGEFTDTSLLEPMYVLANQLLSANNIILAYPVYYHMVPAVVKAWMECVCIKELTWRFDLEKGYVGLLSNKNALVLATSGNVYSSSETNNFHIPYVKSFFSFLGIDTKVVVAEGLNPSGVAISALEEEKVFSQAITQALSIVSDWK